MIRTVFESVLGVVILILALNIYLEKRHHVQPGPHWHVELDCRYHTHSWVADAEPTYDQQAHLLRFSVDGVPTLVQGDVVITYK